jgi:SAM-dependent methyltransferase
MISPSPHPLAVLLIERLRDCPQARVLEVGSGSGRNTAALQNAGLQVTAIADDCVTSFPAAGNFDGALSTHGLLHGTPQTIRGILDACAHVLRAGAPFYATFGSKSDARYGAGTLIERDVFAPDSGSEIGVAHAYFDESGVRRLLETWFITESLEEHAVDEVVGRWAHAEKPRGSIHWFLRALRR